MELYSKKYKYLCIYSAKSGCSSIRKLFLELHKEEAGIDSSVGYHDLEHFSPVPEDLDRSNVKKIAVVRNPYSRIVSAFANKYVNTDYPPKSWLSKCFEKSERGALPQENFVSFVRRLKEIYDDGDLDFFDIHTRRQTFGLDLSDPNLFVVNLEKFDRQINIAYSLIDRELSSRVGFMLHLGLHENSTSYGFNLSDAHQRVFVPGEPFPHFSKMCDEECKSTVSEIYKDDFIGLGYSFSMRHCMVI